MAALVIAEHDNATLKGAAATLEGSGEAKVKAAAVTLAGNTSFSPS